MVQKISSSSNNLKEDEPMLGSTSVDPEPESHSVVEDAYKELSRIMMADPVKTTNPLVNLELMETALKNRNVPFAKNHMEELNKQINKDNALEVVLKIGKWVHWSENQPVNFEPSAPPLVENDEERKDNWMVEPLRRLRENCLHVIDLNGDMILKKKEIENLHYNDLLDMTSRDSLIVSSESIIYSAIMRWYEQECERRALDKDTANPNSILKDLIYTTRYGLMSEKEFLSRTIDGHKGPDRMGILNEREINDILEYIKQREKKKKIPKELPFKMSKKRTNELKQCKKHRMETCIINMLSCLVAVFD
ncbi:BTB/POZ domain-containing protein 1-like isoform X2 [Sitophilus oryzae]|nr:BTB/POZ domain-containing protein 1-like isoform X2 [Sitophilus oryzae]XP_030758086.1 BTB/POZ domain-containing protein 1-like isoform X2 [Sitophilus oryzae]XP_030758087.1 BTB/POZ domain-containing protein 1-like isoform X2 [Sitophilus oryzae]XP_030758088.1 BTB/POZ domain-containing protein 1-like isoform X2 [Sitophilus oryzae]